MKYYAIGDVHGEYETLLKLVAKLPKKVELFFVGDLIDRGPGSKKVVDFVRKGNYQCVLGNHEDMMIEEAKRMRKERLNYVVDELWAANGGLSTLYSYGIIDADKDGCIIYTKNESNIDKFLDDAEWMASLPLFITVLEVKWKGCYDVVVSHAAIGESWPITKGNEHAHKEHIIWNREQKGVFPTFQMFNVFGHTPHGDAKVNGADLISGNWMNIDSGCTYNRDGLGKLTALNLETLEAISQKKT